MVGVSDGRKTGVKWTCIAVAGLSICVCVFEHAWETFSVEETNEREFTGGRNENWVR